MKTLGICAMMALATLSIAPAMADDSAYSKAIALAAPDSDAAIEDVAYALYLAVEANPDKAAGMLSMVLDRRTKWTSKEVYTLLCAVMMAHPDLMTPSKEHITGEDGSEGGPEAGAPAEGGEGASGTEPAPATGSVLADGIKGTVMGDVITVIYNAELPEGVASSVLEAAGLSDAVVAAPVEGAGAAPDAEGGETPEGGSEAPEGTTPEGVTPEGATPEGGADAPINDMVQTNQSVMSGTLGGSSRVEDITEPTVNPPSDDMSTPGADSGQSAGLY